MSIKIILLEDLMLLKKVRIKNFRSLNDIEFDMGNYLVVFGKNNEGKSNILKSIKRYGEIISFLVHNERRYSKSNGMKLRKYLFKDALNNKSNNLENDIPINIQELKNTKRTTNITLVFELNPDEVKDLNDILTSTSRATDYLEITISYSRELDCKVLVKLKKDGRSLSVLKNIFITLRFLQANFSIDYIPSVRTEDHSVDIIEEIISQKLKVLEESEEYIESLNKINELQTGVLNELSSIIAPDLSRYLNSIKSVEIVPSRQNLIRFMRNNYEIMIDDGKKTNLVDKGDGIKSLVALSLLQGSDGKSRILMIDEPEAHLHSGAIKALELQIKDECNQQQVLVASHHQIFVNRNNFSSNLILSSGRLKKKTDVRMIREELGVGLGENLLNSELIVLVEGETDKHIFEKYIKLTNEKLANLIRENRLIIDAIRGVKNLESKLSFYTSGLCKCICILDQDSASEKFITTVIDKNLIDEKQIFTVPLYGKASSELEDLYDENFMFKNVDAFFDLSNSISRKNMKSEEKFTNKLEAILDSYGKKIGKDEEKFKRYLVEEISAYKDLSFLSSEGQLFFGPILDKIISEVYI